MDRPARQRDGHRALSARGAARVDSRAPLWQTHQMLPFGDKRQRSKLRGVHPRLLIGLLACCAGGGEAAALTPRPAQVKVLFDAGHAQRFLPSKAGPLQLDKLAKALARHGVVLQVHRGAITKAALAKVAAVWIAGPFMPYRKAEVDALEAFVKRGGRLVVALHIGPPLAKLLWRFSVSISNAVLRDPGAAIGARVKDFYAHPTKVRHTLTRGVKKVGFYGAWALLGRNKKTCRDLLTTTAKAWVDLNRDGVRGAGDPRQRFSVAVLSASGRGHVVVFGDDAVFQNRFLKGGNKRLAVRLARWIAAGRLAPAAR